MGGGGGGGGGGRGRRVAYALQFGVWVSERWMKPWKKIVQKGSDFLKPSVRGSVQATGFSFTGQLDLGPGETITESP